MEKLYAYKKDNITRFYEEDCFFEDSEELSLFEKNGAFLLFKGELSEENIIDIFSKKEDMLKCFDEYCSDTFNKNYITLNCSPFLLVEIEEVLSYYDGLQPKDFQKLIKNDKLIIEHINNTLQDFNDYYIEPIYREYIAKSRTSQKRIEDLEEMLALRTDNFTGYSFFDSFQDLLGRLTFFIKKDVEVILFIQNYISTFYTSSYIDILDNDIEEHFFLKLVENKI